MPATYLFRIDMKPENEPFFNARKSLASHVYAGISVGIGSFSDWIPDLIEIVVDETKNFTLRLIELEDTKDKAAISSRKYLPENSQEIVEKFLEYLEQVISKSRSSADSRENEFIRLKTILSNAEKFVVTTAGALRSSSDLLKIYP